MTGQSQFALLVMAGLVSLAWYARGPRRGDPKRRSSGSDSGVGGTLGGEGGHASSAHASSAHASCGPDDGGGDCGGGDGGGGGGD